MIEDVYVAYLTGAIREWPAGLSLPNRSEALRKL